MGWEFHGDAAPIPGLEIVAEASPCTRHIAPFPTTTIYPTAKGGLSSTPDHLWCLGLAAPPAPVWSTTRGPTGPIPVEQITHNLLRRH